MNIEKRRDFVEALRKKLPAGTTLTEADRLVDAFAGAVHAAIQAGATVVAIPDVGKIEVIATKARKGHNPATGQAIDIPAGRKIKMTPAHGLRSLVKGGA